MGWGSAFGGTPIVPVSNPAAGINGDSPITVDFSDAIDGSLPGGWEALVLADDGAGVQTGSAEPSPSSYFRVVGGRAGWFYRRIPAVPPPAAQFEEHGAVASPQGIVVGRNAEVAVLFDAPPRLLDGSADQFVLDVAVGLRARDDGMAWVGGRARAEWAAGAWTVPIAVEAVAASGGPPAVLAAATIPTLNDPTDVWDASPLHELRVSVRGGVLRVALDGVVAVEAAVANASGSKVVVVARVYNRVGAGIVPTPAIAAVQFRTLRDPERLGPPPAIGGDIDLDAPIVPKMHLPLGDLLDKGLLRRVGSRAFVATADVSVEVPNGRYAFATGDVIRALEPYEGQLMTSVVRDLAAHRTRRDG